MKRLLVVLLSILYLAAGVGFTLREHYCMGERISAMIEHPAQHSDDHRCARCGMGRKAGHKAGCCKDKVKTFKSTQDQIMAKALPALHTSPDAVLPASFSLFHTARLYAAGRTTAAPVHGPPLITGLPLYLRVRCLRL